MKLSKAWARASAGLVGIKSISSRVTVKNGGSDTQLFHFHSCCTVRGILSNRRVLNAKSLELRLV